MHLLIDLRGCHVNQERGIPRYVQQLARAIASQKGQDQLSFLLSREMPPLVAEAEFATLGKLVWHEDLEVSSARFDAVLFGSVVHGLGQHKSFERYLFPPALAAHRPVTSAIVYDFVPALFSNQYLPTKWHQRNYFSMLQSLGKVDIKFAISKATANDALQFFPGSTAVNIYGDVDRAAWSKYTGSPQIKEIVYIAGDDWRKNLPEAIRGFAASKASQSGYKLVVICTLSENALQRYSAAAEGAGLVIGNNIEFTGRLSDDDVVRRVSSATFTFFPSLYEGLGLPILESYVAGVPVLGSNVSSIRELVAPSCQFDPSSLRSMAEAIDRFIVDKSLAIDSMDFAENILTQTTWENAAKTVLCSLRTAFAKIKVTVQETNRLAVFGALAPSPSGVAIYNSKAFVDIPVPIDFYTETKCVREAEHMWHALKKKDAPRRIFRAENFGLIEPLKSYAGQIYVLGNSEHNKIAFEAVKANRYHKSEPIIYLHDARVTGLLLTCQYGGSFEQLKTALASHYPTYKVSRQTPFEMLTSRVLGMRVLHSLVGNARYLVNSERARQLVLEDLGNVFPSPKIDILFHPIFNQAECAARMAAHPAAAKLKIGHFGILGPTKCPDLILSVAAEMEKQGRLESLCFAGYQVSQYFVGRTLPHYVRFIDSPSERKLINLMSNVDVAIQPRLPDHGESSGVVRQLVSVGTPTFVSAGTSDAEMAPIIEILKSNTDPKPVASQIMSADLHRRTRSHHLYSTKRFAEKLLEILQLSA